MKQHFFELLKALESSMILGSIAGAIRVFLAPERHWKEKIGVFIMSLLLANLAGILVKDLEINPVYQTSIIAGVALIGREVLETLIKITPSLLKKYLTKKIEKQ